MLEGGHIGIVEFVHFHDALTIIPCIRTTIVDHQIATHAIFDAASDIEGPMVEVITEMREGSQIGAVDVLVSDPNAPLMVRVGERTYVLRDGALVEA